MNMRLQGTVDLPGSKSESNRALMLAAYGGFPIEADNLSEAHDTVLLQKVLKQVEGCVPETGFTVDCEDAGTVARFMMTYLACRPGTWIMTGTQRLCERPMAPLIGALRQLGAQVECLGEEGGLPVRIQGKTLRGGKIELDASQSSQFVSSLLMAAPLWPQGLVVELLGRPSSLPYIDMTLDIMRQYGADAVRNGSDIVVRRKAYHPHHFTVSPDWSSASYWYEMMALGEGGELFLKGLKTNSIQGDSAVVEMFGKLGVKTNFLEDGVKLSKSKSNKLMWSEPITFDFVNTPDLFPSVFVTCIALHIDTIFIGVSTLSKKESDRINALIIELSKIYTFINIVTDDKIIIRKSSLRENQFDREKVVFNTYHDHRIAMSLASLCPQTGPVTVDDPAVVNKSYPGFWDALKLRT